MQVVANGRATVIENLEDLSIGEVIEQFDVTREQVTAVLEQNLRQRCIALIVLTGSTKRSRVRQRADRIAAVSPM